MSEIKDKRVILGGILILIGLFWILEVFNVIPYYVFDEFISIPGFSLLLGLFLLITSRHKFLGVIFTLFGGYHLLDEFFNVPYNLERLILPTFLVLLGTYIIVRSQKKSLSIGTSEDGSDYIDDVAILGGGEKIVNSNNLRGGKITAIMGGSEIDFTNSKLGEGSKVFDMFVLFGGSKLLIPEDWAIKSEVTTLFGGYSDKRKLDPNRIPDPRKEVVMKGIVLFGGVEIKSF